MPEQPAYLIGHITVKEPAKWAEYRIRVPGTLEPWGAELVFRGRRPAVLSGEHADADAVVIRFPSADALSGWHASAAYQSLIYLHPARPRQYPERDQGTAGASPDGDPARPDPTIEAMETAATQPPEQVKTTPRLRWRMMSGKAV